MSDTVENDMERLNRIESMIQSKDLSEEDLKFLYQVERSIKSGASFPKMKRLIRLYSMRDYKSDLSKLFNVPENNIQFGVHPDTRQDGELAVPIIEDKTVIFVNNDLDIYKNLSLNTPHPLQVVIGNVQSSYYYEPITCFKNLKTITGTFYVTKSEYINLQNLENINRNFRIMHVKTSNISKLERVGGDLYAHDTKIDAPNLQEIDGDLHASYVIFDAPKLQKVGGDVYFKDMEEVYKSRDWYAITKGSVFVNSKLMPRETEITPKL